MEAPLPVLELPVIAPVHPQPDLNPSDEEPSNTTVSISEIETEPTNASSCDDDPAGISIANILPNRLRHAAHFTTHEEEPKSLNDIVGRADEEHWRAAINCELASLAKHSTWTPISSLPPDRRAISSKWVLKIKRLPDGSIA